MKQRLSTSRKAKILRGRKPAVSSAKIVSNATNLVHIRGNKVLERILDDGYSGMMVSQKSKADKAAEFLSEVTVEEWDHLLRALTSKWETAFANRQMQARREGNSTPPPAPPHVDVDFETTEPRKRQVAGGALTVEKLIDRYLTD